MSEKRLVLPKKTTGYFSFFDKICKDYHIFFDDHEFWWIWDCENFKWRMTDETGVYMFILSLLNNSDYASKSQVKSSIFTALRPAARKNFPKIAEKTWIQFRDTIVDISSGKRFKASPEYFVTNSIPHSIGDSFETPNIDRLFKNCVIKEGIQDGSWVTTLEEIVAYSMFRFQPFQKIFALVGSGRNGKSSFIQFLTKFLGDENVVASDLHNMCENRFETIRLRNKLVVVFPEVSEDNLRNSSILKQMTGEDKMRMEQKNHPVFDDYSYATAICFTNNLPATQDTSDAFYRRWVILDFPNKYEVAAFREHPVDLITEQEYENFCFKTIKIAKKLLEKGVFTNEGSFEDKRKRYEERSNPVGSFLKESYDDDDSKFVVFSLLYKQFSVWAKGKVTREISSKKFGQILQNLGFEGQIKRVSEGDESRVSYIIWGLSEKRTKKKAIVELNKFS